MVAAHSNVSTQCLSVTAQLQDCELDTGCMMAIPVLFPALWDVSSSSTLKLLDCKCEPRDLELLGGQVGWCLIV